MRAGRLHAVMDGVVPEKLCTSDHNSSHRPVVPQTCSHSQRVVLRTVKFFSKLNLFILGHSDPVNNCFDNKVNIFRGDLSDISAKTATLVAKPYMTEALGIFVKVPYFVALQGSYRVILSLASYTIVSL